jgi:hypothetical protein
MIRDSILDTELAEPAIGEVHLHFSTDQSLRADRKDITTDLARTGTEVGWSLE